MNGTNERPSLQEIQEWMRWLITDPRGPELALETQGRQSTLARIGGPESSREHRLAIYADAYFLRIAEVLEEDFRTLSALLGKESFYQLTSDYLDKHPSTSPNIGEIGRKLPEFLWDYPLTRNMPYLPELALLEWSVNESFFANFMPPIDLSVLKESSPSQWEQARFELDPSVQILETRWPLHRVWVETHRKTFNAKFVPVMPRKERLLIYRGSDLDVQVSKLAQVPLAVLRGIQAGFTLGELCLRAEKGLGDETSVRVQGWFQEWVQNGIIRKVVFP